MHLEEAKGQCRGLNCPGVPTGSLQIWKGIRATPTKKKKNKQQCFLSVVVFFLFASPALSEPLFGVLSCLSLLVRQGQGEALGWTGAGRMPGPPCALYVIHVTPIKQAS